MLAWICANCPVCRRARLRQRGAAFRWLKKVKARLCPFCRAYERVHGRQAQEPLSHQLARPPSKTPLTS